MPEFSYEALATTGQRNKGTLTAGSEREVMAMLDARGLFPVTIAPVKTTASHRWGRKIKARYMATFYAQLADLLRSGVPLLRSLDILERQGAQPALAEVIRESYPDPTAQAGEPWVVVDVKAVTPLKTPVTLAAIRAELRLKDMALVKLSRLSVQPVTPAEWKLVCEMGGVKP